MLWGESHARSRSGVVDLVEFYEVRGKPQRRQRSIDAPQQGRIIEIWRDGGTMELRYSFFSHLDEIDPPEEADSNLFDDPLMLLRRIAAELAGATP